jgi:hypothetical protein
MNAKEAAFHDMVEEGLTISVFVQEKAILELTRTISIDDIEVEIKVRHRFVPVTNKFKTSPVGQGKQL